MNTRTSALPLSVIACAALLASCASPSVDDEPVAEAQSAFSDPFSPGKALFDDALPGTNGRSCATCHVEDEHLALSRAHVASVFQSNPSDPLFNRIDADDPTAATPTYAHLEAGLVRVTLNLADNLDVVDAAGNVITNAERTITVWRGVPTTENTAYTAPFQYDDREKTLESQADAALHAHSQINHEPSPLTLDAIAGFERTMFSSDEAALIAGAIDFGFTPPNLQPYFAPGSDGAAGQVLFNNICANCHGTATQTQVVNQAVHDDLFAVTNADGSVTLASVLPTGVGIPAQVHHDLASHRDLNIGIAATTYLGQVGALPNFQGVDFPQYRIRFYKDASRKTKVFDLPPPPPEYSSSLLPQAFSVDPGRAIISGDPDDWETFAVPQLRGVANTAPYFHDGVAPDLPTLLDLYSQLILPAIPALNLPANQPPETPGGFPEALTPTQKAQLLAFLQKI
jgi:cytochrome c peroxidase